MVTDRASADILCKNCGSVWGKWNPEHPGDCPPERTIYERVNYFETVLDNTLGYDTNRFSMNDLAVMRRENPTVAPDAWNVGIVRSTTRRLKMSRLTKSAGRMAHALRFGVRCPYPRLHHIERECMSGMFRYAAKLFEEKKGNRTRKNLISYAFLVGKLLEEMGRGEDFRHLIVPIKTKSKLAFAENMWKMVEKKAPWKSSLRHADNRLGWDYVASIEPQRLPLRNNADGTSP
jgi:hypothetical protein